MATQVTLNSGSVDSAGSLALKTNGTTTAVTIDTSQNVGIGVTPSAWFSGTKAVQLLGASFTSTASTGYLYQNSYLDTNTVEKYYANGFASKATLSSGGHQWFTAASGTAGGTISFTQAMTLNASGYLLVGATSSAGVGATRLQVGSTSSLTSQMLVQSTTTSIGLYASGAAENYLSYLTGSALIIGNGPADGSTFTERARIDSSGNLGVNTNSPSSYGALAVRKGVAGTWLGVTSSSSFHTSDALNNSFYITHNSDNGGSTFLCSDAGGRLQMFCSSSATGGVYLGNGATSWTSASDERVKENLVPIENGLAKVASLRTVTGNYINDETKKSRAFLIAQDVEAVLPEAVDHSNPDELGLSYTDVIPLLVASIQEMKAIIDTQASTITQLQTDVAALKGTA